MCRSFPSATAGYSRAEVDNDGDDEAKESKSLGKNKDEDHTHNHVFLGVCTDCGITNDTDGEARGEGGETTAESSSELLVALVATVVVVSNSHLFEGCHLD